MKRFYLYVHKDPYYKHKHRVIDFEVSGPYNPRNTDDYPQGLTLKHRYNFSDIRQAKRDYKVLRIKRVL